MSRKQVNGNGKNKIKCCLSGKIINSNEEVVKVKYAEELLKKLGYKIIKPSMISIVTIASLFFFMFGMILLMPSVSAWDLKNYIYEDEVISVSNGIPNGMFFKPDGLTLYELGGWHLAQYSCSEPFEIETCSKIKQNGLTGNNDGDLFFTPDGTRLIYTAIYSRRIYQLDCSTAWDSATCTNNLTELYFSPSRYPMGLFFKSDGTKMYVQSYDNERLYQYNCSMPYNITSCSIESYKNMPGSFAMGIYFKPDGKKLFSTSKGDTYIYQWECSTAWDITTCAFANSKPSLDGYPYSLWISPDKEKLFLLGRQTPRIFQYNYYDIYLSSPINNSRTNENEVNFIFELLNNSANVKNITIKLNDEIIYSDDSGTKTEYNISYEIENGKYNYSVNYYDDNNTLYESETKLFEVDNKIDVFKTKLNQTDVDYGKNITLLYSINDSYGMQRCYYTYATEEHNLSCGMYKQAEIKTINAVEEFNEIKVYAIDNNNNQKSITLLFNEPRGIFYLDLEQDYYILLIFMLLALALFFYIISYSVFTAIILIVVGFLLLFNQVNIVISLLVLFAGIYITFLINKE